MIAIILYDVKYPRSCFYSLRYSVLGSRKFEIFNSRGFGIIFKRKSFVAIILYDIK